MVMTKNLLVIFIFVCLLASCATVPPPRIENGLYINPKFYYSIKLPPGWTPREDIPDWFKKDVPYDLLDKIQIVFFNNETNGAIIIASDKTFIDLQIYNKKHISSAIESALKREVENARKEPYVEKINYTVYEPSSILAPSLVSVTEGRMSTEFMKLAVENNIFLYTCEENDTCIFSIFLISLLRTFEENKEIFKEMINSLEKQDYSADA